MNDLVVLVSTLLCVFVYSAVSQEKPRNVDQLRNVKRVAKLPDGFAPKIVGGQEAIPHEFPSAVRVLSGGGFFKCTGSILSREYVLTAAHCLTEEDPNKPFDYSVVVGDHHIKEKERSEQRLSVIQVIKHEKYNESKNQFRYDIGILKVSPKIRFNSRVVPANLPTCKDWKPGPVTYAGWGFDDPSNQHLSDTLKKVNGTIESYEDCAKMIDSIEPGYPFPVSSICSFSTGEAVCQGDSGGPVYSSDENGTLIQVGINSGYVIAKQEDLCKTGVQIGTTVGYYVGWIHRRISDCGNYPNRP